MEIAMKSGPVETGFGNVPDREWPVIPERTLVDCEVVKINLRELNPEFRARFDIKDEHEVSFDFRVTDGEFRGQRIFGTAKPYLNDSDTCRLRFWLQEILGVDSLPGDFVFKLDENNEAPDLVGLRCRVLVKNRVRKSDGKRSHVVGEVLRAQQATTLSEADF